ncbi:VOC family protein [Ruegeria sp. WL0004]|uniref:VOC family protein n=1 Tax=Ruegeria marisflavi TaxID=2984152 RepID=A0ABT2WJX6_9RHOB|nr:VOC family protein [Ruegeria sp. WL0004]MCU9836205.1 VOC family protein [Ruegeria sp. WL0004]
MRLAALHLRAADPAALAGFYRDTLGMTASKRGEAWHVGYGGPDADLILLAGGGGYQHDRGQRYWKIGITLPDVDLAVQALRAQGVAVSDPRQFGDIGYMCHLTDPEGFVIELLQQDFEGNRPPGAADPSAPFAAATLAHITLRSGDIARDEAICRGLGMTLLSVQEVADHGFDLFFFGFSAQTPPDPDLWSVANREWLWKRPYTLIEFQHVEGAEFTPVPALAGIGVEGLTATGLDLRGTPLLPS